MANEKPNTEAIKWQEDIKAMQRKGIQTNGLVLDGITPHEQFNLCDTEQLIIKLLTAPKLDSYKLFNAIDSLKHSLKGFDVDYINNLFMDNLNRLMTIKESQRFFKLLRTFKHGWQLIPKYDGAMAAQPHIKSVYFAEVM